MGARSTIEWTDVTWNPTTGCTKLTAGCENCYASELAERRLRDVYLQRLPVLDTEEARQDPFAVRTWPDRLDQPRRWARPQLVFVNSMSDLFHADIPEQFVRDVFEVMLDVDRHIYQVLTKRPSRARRFWGRHQDLFERRPLPAHVWLGTSVENQEVSYRIDHLRDVPAEVRFLSCEPLLGPLDLDLAGIHWVIAGGESGPGYRALDLDHARGVRDQAVRQGVPFFFKQVGGRTSKAGGRLLDGRTWDELPQEVAGRT